ncbi:MAG: D-glycero-beta-D-manno-heptose 1-phosphate adenylyltransferase [Syntrophobacterales bacterium]|nr:MAG: D-glycero-beta-D-manno-heptose 1-phosphate adenylyltransferase [Syntrophobacterales bacterium]
MREKIKVRDELQNILKGLKRMKKRIVFTNGCFDILHIGHVRCLEEAKKLGDILVVALNSDRSMRSIKGPPRPFIPEAERAEVISALECVDYVVIFDELDPLQLISSLRPDILVKGGDWTPETTIGREVVEKVGGKVVIIPQIQGFSTSAIIDRIVKKGERAH